jgi:fatty acid desaturase
MNADPLSGPATERPHEGVDLEAFLRDIRALKKEIRADLGPDDLAHLEKMERWGRTATAIGLLTAWMGPNPLSVGGLALGRSVNWMLMHHIGHRGYDRVPGVKPRHTSRVFAKGWRRWLDWPDWIHPAAWCHEHNVLHHSFTGEADDPDQFERNTEWVDALPRPVRWGLLAGLTLTWRATYYAPGTMREWMHKGGRTPSRAAVRRAVLTRCVLPYAATQFGVLPALFLPLGPFAVASALVNSVLADLVTNAHTFLVVGPNHAGDDLYRFEDRPGGKAEWYWRQVVGSTNYATGGDLLDFAHLWLNYQIEHHLFPDIPMLQYRKAQPKVRAICEKHGIPYTQQSVWKRFAKMARVFVGDEKMPRAVSREEPRVTVKASAA